MATPAAERRTACGRGRASTTNFVLLASRRFFSLPAKHTNPDWEGRNMAHTAINYLAVMVAGVAYMVVGAFWYTPGLFGNAWMKGIGKTKEQVKADFSPFKMVWAIIFSLIAAYGIARILSWTGGDSVKDGILVGLLVGVCFVLTSFGVNDVFEGRPKGLTVINILYHLVGLVIAGIIIGAWR
jgi:hypothetical protein